MLQGLHPIERCHAAMQVTDFNLSRLLEDTIGSKNSSMAAMNPVSSLRLQGPYTVLTRCQCTRSTQALQFSNVAASALLPNGGRWHVMLNIVSPSAACCSAGWRPRLCRESAQHLLQARPAVLTSFAHHDENADKFS